MCLNAKILVIEDDSDYLTRIITRLRKKGYQAITPVTTETEAINELKNNYYDVIVADMRLGENNKGAFSIIEEVKNYNVTSILIILTVNASFEDCRRALQYGGRGICWDYIPKDKPGVSSLEELHDSIQMGLNSRDNRRDAEWIETNQTELLEKYAGKYIAAINHQVIVVADSNEEVKSELERLGLPLFVTVIRKIEVQLPSIEELITLGESGNLEFKSTLSWGVKENKKLDTLHYSVLKTIAAFLNSGDGRLLIGVANDGSIYGLEKDYSLCKTKDFDGFQLRLWDFIHDNIGKAFTNYIKIDFYTIEGKCVCAVDVIKAPELAFLKENNVKKFYIRSGNNSRDLDAEQLYNYLKMRGDV